MASSQESILLLPWDNRLIDKVSDEAEHVLIELLSTTAAFSVTLPDLRNSYNKEYMFKNTGANTVMIVTTDNQLFDDGTQAATIPAGDFFSCRSNNVDKWIALGNASTSLLLNSPNGHHWAITVSNAGSLTATDLG